MHVPRAFLSSLVRQLVGIFCLLLLPGGWVRAQPAFQQVSPVANAVAAAPNSPVTFTFSQALIADATALKVYSAQRGGLRTAATPAVLSGATLRFTPPTAYPFMPGETLFNTVTKQVASSSGTLPNGRVTQFTTAVSPASGGLFLPGTDAAAGTKSSIVALGDADGDGDLDLFTLRYDVPTALTRISIQLNGGDATGSNTGVYSGGSDIPMFGTNTSLAYNRDLSTGFLILGDLDGDGDLDFFVSNGVRMVEFINTGKNTAIFTGTLLSPFFSYAQDGALGDLDGDGDLDLVIVQGSPSSGSLRIFLNGGTGIGTNTGLFSLPPTTFFYPVSSTQQYYGVALGDVDGDGDLDILCAIWYSGSNGLIRTYLNGRDSLGPNLTGFTATPNPATPDLLVDSYPTKLVVGDIDGDGDLDLICAVNAFYYDPYSSGQNSVNVALNGGDATGSHTGSFTVSQKIVTGVQSSGLILGDVDGDGDLDLVVANKANNTLSVRLNGGNAQGTNTGVFTGSQNIAVGLSPTSVALGDIDGDGDLDLVAGNYIATAGTVSVRLNQPVANLTALSTAAELPGLPITLTGTGFGSGTSVSFGALAATGLIVNSSTSLTVVVPAGLAAGSAPVAVATSGVSGHQSSLPFTVLAVANTVTSTCPATVPYQATGDGQWHYLFTTSGQVVAALLDTRAALGQVAVQFQLIDPATPVRQDGRNHAYFDRNFHLTTSGGLFPGISIALRFYGLNPELDRLKLADPTVTAATLRTTQYSGANEDCDFANDDFTTGQFRALAAPVSTPSGAAWFVADVTVTDHFSEFFLTGSATPLPVVLTAFTATRLAGGPAVKLAWTTASEQGSAHFEIEGSADGQRFTTVGTTPAAGQSNAPRAYSLTDFAPPAPRLFYRLRQVDQDGTVAYSPIRRVAGGSAPDGLAIFPNPARSTARLTGARPGTVVQVLDAVGRPVATGTADATGAVGLVLPVGLPAGLYLVRAGTQARSLLIE